MANQIVVSSGAKVRNLEGVLTGASGVVSSLGINVPDGIPQLDGSGKILVSQLPNSVMEYKGTWNAATNTPTLANGTGNQGDVYLCEVAGTVNFGAGPIQFFVGDQVIYSGSIWQRASGATGTVTSVALTESGDSLNITGSPITTSGTINIGFNGNSGQYINGAGNLTTFPSLTGFVPYTGATTNVDLGTYGLLADYLKLNVLPTSIPTTESTMSWNDTDGTMDIKLKGGNVTLQVGQEQVVRVVNKSGASLLEADYKVVRIRSVAEGGAQGQRLAVVLAQGDTAAHSKGVLGLVTETIADNQEGFITILGQVHEIDTTGTLQGETWVDGDKLYLSATTAGKLTKVAPVAPNHSVVMGYVEYAHAVHGKIFVNVNEGISLDEIHDVYAPSPTANQSIFWNASTIRYENNTIAGVLGYTPANAATTISTTAPLSGGGDLSTNRTFSISQATTSTNGYLSSVDWNTFNNKQNALGYTPVPNTRTLTINGVGYDLTADRSWSIVAGVSSVTATSPLFSSGGANPNITIQQATSLQSGYLSALDWVEFNTKQEQLDGLGFVKVSGTTISYDNTAYVPTSRTLTINGTAYDLSANRTWSVGTVTSVAALTLGTAGSDLSSTVANGSTTPVITLNVPTASAANRGALSAADWSTFNTKVGSVTASSPLASSGGTTPNITIQQASGSQAGYLSSIDWTTFNNKQAAGNYITSLTGEATATGPGAAAVTLNNASVTGKVLTGVNITGGTVLATDTMLTAFGKLQNQINGLVGGSIYQGTWNASTNTPSLASGVGTKGYYYIVSVAGSTNLDGITDWNVGDWAIFDGTAWQQVDNTDAVVSVNGQTGAVSLTTDNISEGATNKYFSNTLARAALSFTAGSGAYNSTTGVITIPTNTNQITNGANFITLTSLSGTAPIVYSNTTGAISITQAGTASNGYLSSTDWNTFNNKTSNTGTVTSIATTGPITGGTITTSGTIGITQAGTASNGYLSSTDWNTFNNKQGALTNPVTGTGTTNYLPKFTGTSTIGNSIISESGTAISVAGSLTTTDYINIRKDGSDTPFGGSYMSVSNAANNVSWGWQLGASNKLSLWLYNGGPTTNALNITTSGNLGLGVTPSAWSAGYKSIQVAQQGGTVFGNTTISSLGIASNGYYDGTNWLYNNSDTAGQFRIDGNVHKWFNAASGTAGTTISFTQAMTLASTGNLLVGTTTDAGYKLDVNGQIRASATSAITLLTLSGNGNNITNAYLSNTDTGSSARGNYEIATDSANVLFFATSSTNTSSALGGRASTGGIFTSSGNTAGGLAFLARNASGYITFHTGGSTERLRIAANGAATFSSSVTASAFFESSSIKGKDIIATNPLLALDIDVIKYTRKNDKNKDIRYGYSAEQIHSLMPELTDKDVTAVKYLDVHTILIANLQREIKELKAKLN